MTPQEQWLLQKERALSWIRIWFAMIALIVIQINPSRAARFPALSYFSVVAFLLYSLQVAYLARKKTANSRSIGVVTTCLDLMWVSLIVFSTGAARTPFFVYYLFPVIGASSRYGVKGALAVAALGLAVYGFIRLNVPWGHPMSLDLFIVRSSYLLVLAYMFGFLSEFEKKQNERLLGLSRTAGEVGALEARRQIAQELHDGLLQSLATQILRLESCRKQFLNSPEQVDQELRSIEMDTRGIIKEIRQFLEGKETRPFPPGMLLDKLKQDLRFLQDALGLQISLDAGELSVPEPVEREVYFTVREALMNAMRHSHASRLEIEIDQKNMSLEAVIRDDGIGFDTVTSQNSRGLGLANMKQRIKKLGGELSLKSAPGKGTTVSLLVPLVAMSNTG